MMPSAERVVRRHFWCSEAEREVEVCIEERGFPGFRRPVAVRSCSAFATPGDVRCRRSCLDVHARRRVPAARPPGPSRRPIAHEPWPDGEPRRQPHGRATAPSAPSPAIEEGDRVLTLLADHRFREAWRRLHASCPWATAFQDIEFVDLWYRSYLAAFSPVLALERSGDGLAAVLPLAAARSGRQLVVAGGHQAEYQTWLSAPAASADFITRALARLRREYPRHTLAFRYLPPSTPTACFSAGPLEPYASVVPCSRPLRDVAQDAPAAEAAMRKKGNRNRVNHLARRGDLRIERITGVDEFDEVLDRIVPYYDLRQEAVNGDPPFALDPQKRRFHVALLKAGLLHVSVLRAGDEILAAQCGVHDHRQVHLGILAHSPFHARYSPGRLLLHMLGEMLGAEGYSWLDLTPGGDPWKERLASARDQVHVVTIFPSRAARRLDALGRRLRRAVRALAGLVGVTPGSLKASLARLRRTVASTMRRLPAALWRDTEYRVYSLPRERAAALAPPAVPLSRDSLDDLLTFAPGEPGQARQDVLRIALARLESGQHLYTRVEDGRLVFSAWLSDRLEQPPGLPLGSGLTLPAGSLMLHDVRGGPDARDGGLHEASVAHMLADAAATTSTGDVYVGVMADDAPVRRAIETLGLEYRGGVLGRVRPWGRAVEAREAAEPAPASGGRR
jgi:CelD/BcsL family acetyltransferase involved in cellulose biosynthesis